MYCALAKNTTCPDVVIADTAVGYLQQWETEKADGTQQKPFFVAMGIHKVSNIFWITIPLCAPVYTYVELSVIASVDC